MFSQVFYLIRSKTDGQYLVARPQSSSVSSKERNQPDPGYLLMFKEDFEALSYLNTHGSGVASHFAVESIAGSQIGNLLKRWGFTGVGVVQDPLLPRIEFFRQD